MKEPVFSISLHKDALTNMITKHLELEGLECESVVFKNYLDEIHVLGEDDHIVLEFQTK